MQPTYMQKVKALRAARNKLRTEAVALRKRMRKHRSAVNNSFMPGEIDSWVRGSLMVDLEVF